MNGMFYAAASFNQDVDHFKVTNVYDLGFMFYGTSFDQTLAYWDTSSALSMAGMFASSPFNQDISHFVVDNVQWFFNIFQNSSFSQSLDAWVTASATEMSSMFESSAFNQALNHLIVDKVTHFDSMLRSSSFNQSLSSWRTSSATSMSEMFFDSPFNFPINNFSVEKVTAFDYMFYASAFNQNIFGWAINASASLIGMFGSAIYFNQNLCLWRTALSNSAVSGIFQGTGRRSQNDPIFLNAIPDSLCHSCCADNKQPCKSSMHCCSGTNGCFGKKKTNRVCKKCAAKNENCVKNSDCCMALKKLRCDCKKKKFVICLKKGRANCSRCCSRKCSKGKCK